MKVVIDVMISFAFPCEICPSTGSLRLTFLLSSFSFTQDSPILLTKGNAILILHLSGILLLDSVTNLFTSSTSQALRKWDMPKI
jgi:hypothetical protein